MQVASPTVGAAAQRANDVTSVGGMHCLHKPIAMNKPFLLAALICAHFVAPIHTVDAACVLAAPIGGPPSIRIAGKAGGEITAAQWSATKAVDLVGCVPGARIISLTFCIKDCKGKDAMINGKDASISSAMRQMIGNLPSGTPFTVKVMVRDEKEKVWEVPDARFLWKG